MKILISPAKKMRSDPDTLAPEALPALLSETERLLSPGPGAVQAFYLYPTPDAAFLQEILQAGAALLYWEGHDPDGEKKFEKSP